MPNADASSPTRRPIRPYPTMPMVDPSRSPTDSWPRCAHRPSRTRAVSGPSRLTRCRAIAMTPSATARLPLPGVITTAMPRAVAAVTSTRSTPTPVRAMTRSRRARSRKAASTTASARAMAPIATAMSSGPGSVTRTACSPRIGCTTAGSTGPSATTMGLSMTGSEGRARHRGYPLPPAALRGRGGGGDDLGDVVGVVDGGVAALAAADGDQELLRFDDLEVVVAHAVARSGLEVAVVAEGLVGQHGRVAGVRSTPAQAHPQLVHLLEVPDRRAVGAVDLEAEPALRADDDPGSFQGADRAAVEADQRRGVVVVLHLAELAVLDHREVGAGSHRQDRPLGIDGTGQRTHLGDRADHVLDQVDDVAQQVAERAGAGEVAAEPPGQRALGFAGVAGEEHRAHVGDPAEVAVRDQLADVFDRRGVAVVVADLRDHAGLGGGGGGDADLAVQAGRRADRHHVDVRVGEHLAVVGGGPGVSEYVTGVLGAVDGGVGGGHEPGPQPQVGVDGGQGLVGAGVQLAHPADADEPDAGSVVGHDGSPDAARACARWVVRAAASRAESEPTVMKVQPSACRAAAVEPSATSSPHALPWWWAAARTRSRAVR